MTNNTYASAGVDIAAGQKAVDLMKEAIRATYTPEVLSDTGNFGGLFAVHALKNLQSPILVASTDGVGTKTMVAAKMNQWGTIGQDLVNHCVNDILVQGATPLFFLDYVASSKLQPEQIATIVSGCAIACSGVGCALLGGETAEMPGVYRDGEVDLAGTIVGVVDKPRLIDGSRIREGDVVMGLASTGLHTNGFSLARKVLADLDWTTPQEELGGKSIGEALLAVHRPYLREIQTLWAGDVDVRGLAHITGGGIVDNFPRIFPEGISAVMYRNQWQVLPIFKMIQRVGNISDDEMFHVFNMGLGMLVVIPVDQEAKAQALLPELARVGEMFTGDGGVTLL
jgi:phosphoribosylformylglycinamidine cyclo-ligase